MVLRRWGGVLLGVMLAVSVGIAGAEEPESVPAMVRRGIDPGAVISLPEAYDVFEVPIVPSQLSVVLFTKLVPCNSVCEMAHAVAESWALRYPEMQVIVVSLRNTEDELREFAGRHGVAYRLVADVGGSWERTFQTNANPTGFLVDQEGVVRTKLQGMAPGTVPAFDGLLEAAIRGEWEVVDSLAMRPLALGQQPAPLAGVEFLDGRPTLIYLHDLAIQDIQEGINRLAERYPSVQFLILQRDVGAGARSVWGSYIDIFGLRSVPSSIRNSLITDWADVTVPTLPSDGWADNVQLVTFEAGTAGDPLLIWGKTITPDLMFLDGTGRLVGPYPNYPFPISGSMDYGSAYVRDAVLAGMESLLASHSD